MAHPDYSGAVRNRSDMDINRQGLVVFRASRLEALLQPLQHLLKALPPEGVLTPHTVIAAHPGMRQWLTRALAREAGSRGIVANLDIVLPSAWLDALARRVLGEAAVALAPYRREALRWRVFELLTRSGDTRVQAYLAGNDSSRRRFQLADRIASLFSRYLVYRSDWLTAWADGRDNVPEPSLLAPLWRGIRAGIDAPHRGERLDALLHQLRRLPEGMLPAEPLHLFGVSHLAPQEMAVLRAVARLRPVVLYLPDPCRDYWAGLKPERTRLRELAQLPPNVATTEHVFLQELGHPLLASWGRQGQQFVLALAGDEDVLADIRDGRDDARSDHPSALLDRLQESIRRLQPELLRPPVGFVADDDRSLRVHACHTRLRELEALRDALLRAREDDPAIQPSDMAVLAPDIQSYAPLIPAVFGAAGDARSSLPYHLADIALLHSHPLLIAFSRLLDAPGSRLSAPQVLDILSVPAVQRALSLDSAAVEQLGAWLTEARVAWALDGAAKRAFGVPPNADHSFAWGMDRLLAGYVLGQRGGDEPMVQAFADAVVVPLAGVQGPQCEALGALDRLLCELALLQREAETPRALSGWTAKLEQLVDVLFRIDLRDNDEQEALAIVRRLLRSLTSETLDAGTDPAVEFDVVRDLLQEHLAAPAERQPFLLGGVTFCGMVPQRAIPFKVIAVLGLDDGAFPRNDSDGGIDLMARHRRLGDRDVRGDDRWLFLETVMAARCVLHLSYIGQGVRDGKPRNPAAPLAELLAVLDDAHDLRGADDDVPRPWLVRHPLQPFDPRYFEGCADHDERLYSYRSDLAALAQARSADSEPFLPDQALPTTSDGAAPLKQILEFYRDPARHILRRHLGVNLEALEHSRLRESEPLEPGFDRFDRVGRRLALAALERAEFVLPERPPPWLLHGGLWPVGAAGEKAWVTESAAANAVLKSAQQEPLLQRGLPPIAALDVELDLDGTIVTGELSRLRYRDGHWLVFELSIDPRMKPENELDFRVRVGLFLEWALAHLVLADTKQPLTLLLLTPRGKTPWRDQLNHWSRRLDTARSGGDEAAVQSMLADLRDRVSKLIALWQGAKSRPPWYFPRTSWAAVQSKGDSERIASAWESDDNHIGERDYEPGYTQLLARDARFGENGEDRPSLLATAKQLFDLIRFPQDTGDATSEAEAGDES